MKIQVFVEMDSWKFDGRILPTASHDTRLMDWPILKPHGPPCKCNYRQKPNLSLKKVFASWVPVGFRRVPVDVIRQHGH